MGEFARVGSKLESIRCGFESGLESGLSPTLLRNTVENNVHISSPSSPRCFCQSYDMKPHSTKIFANIVNALGAFIQSLFVHPVVERQSSQSGECVYLSVGLLSI